MPELLKKHIDSGALKVSGSYTDAADFADVFFIAVGTPPQKKKGEYSADLQYVESAIEELVPLLTRDALILGKSTVPVGTAQKLSERVDELAKDVDVQIAWNPEFLREGGFAVADTLHPDRVVLGAFPGSCAEEVCRDIYGSIISSGTPFIVTDPPTAELVKTSANAFLATKISFIKR